VFLVYRRQSGSNLSSGVSLRVPVTVKATNGLWHVTSKVDLQPLARVYTEESHDLK
jgi:hypothetical protein